jgi:hypothetical protein
MQEMTLTSMIAVNQIAWLQRPPNGKVGKFLPMQV